ncbi:MAG: N-acetyl-alpha-D-glucosaminyl L-malate synthase BshA [Bacteroidia bacterium]|nr:N-acetyl-alpha-D-glucosaminyl L-malate synthase BshA [Bacteroidia bacterium]
MNIGIVCYPTYGGSGVVATELGKSLAQRGHKVHFITYSRPIRLEHFTQNVTFHEVRIQDYPLFEYPPYESALTSSMVDVARYQDLDLFHVHYALPHAAAGYFAKQILAEMGKHVPLITTLHGTDITLVGKNKSYEPTVAFSINHSDGVTAVSDFLRQATYEAFDIRNEVRVIPNFVDLNRFKRQDKEHFRKIIAPQGEKIVIHTSNFRKVKRIQDVIYTFQAIRKQIPAKLLMIGDGPERPAAEALCRELGTCDSIHFLGTQNPVEEIYSIGDLFLMPSATESFGLSALEAMACGMPVITSNAGGLPEINQDGVTGYVCEVGDVEKMGIKALSVLQDEGKWAQFSQNAFNKANEFNIDAIVPQYEAYYEEILKRKVSV